MSLNFTFFKKKYCYFISTLTVFATSILLLSLQKKNLRFFISVKTHLIKKKEVKSYLWSIIQTFQTKTAHSVTGGHGEGQRDLRYFLPGSPLPARLGMVWACSKLTTLFRAVGSSSWHQDSSNSHSGFIRRKVTWLTKVPVWKNKDSMRGLQPNIS